MQSKAKSIEEYLSELLPSDREVISALDLLVREILPHAAGSMKFGMPTYECHGRTVAINAQKNYFSIYADPKFVTRYRSELKKLSVGKSCIRFTSMENAPLAVFRKILRDYRQD
jgi:uncharacterized protein YdhG (YjbR/CyaY superfamily)